MTDHTNPDADHDDLDPADRELLSTLASALTRSDPVPDDVVSGARAAFTWRTIDQELAELVFDSSVDLAGVRSTTLERQLTFRTASGESEIELMMTGDDGRRLVGQIIPPEQRQVRLVVDDGFDRGGAFEERVDREQSDALGRFTFDAVPTRPLRIEILDDDGLILLATDWTVL